MKYKKIFINLIFMQNNMNPSKFQDYKSFILLWETFWVSVHLDYFHFAKLNFYPGGYATLLLVGGTGGV